MGHVYGAVPEDEARGGGRWESSDTDVGISYVAPGYPGDYAKSIVALWLRLSLRQV
jgi:hypothetical protein